MNKKTGTAKQIRSRITKLAVIAMIAGSAVLTNSADAYRLGARWTNTASGPTGSGGSPATLTWGFVDDGTNFTNQAGGGSSDLIDFLDDIIGAGPGGNDLTQRPWFPLFEDTFDRWAQVSGLSYIYEPNDDGVNHSGATGQLGVRADVRIGGKFIDGSGNTLAFNFFPTNGDMTFDTGDAAFYGRSAGNYLNLRNVIAHEHGHGIGHFHVESANGRFLMEPFIQTSFDGPQFDDILGAHRGYGDFYEKSFNGLGNDVVTRATPLGLIGDGETAGVGYSVRLGTGPGVAVEVQPEDVDFVSIDDNSDTDFFSFTIDNPASVDVLLSPAGYIYREGPQNGTQSTYRTNELNDLNVALFDSNGTSLLASASDGGVGVPEEISDIDLLSPGEYFVRVRGTLNDAQFYQLEVSVTEPMMMVNGDFNDDGIYDCSDIDALVADVVGAGSPDDFDLNADGVVDGGDVDAWLAEAGEVNLGDGMAYLPGDGNLDGVVDASDFNIWNGSKFTSVPAWCSGDYNTDGVVDASDFNVWNANKFTSSDVTVAVPEPSAAGLMLFAGLGLLFRRRR